MKSCRVADVAVIDCDYFSSFVGLCREGKWKIILISSIMTTEDFFYGAFVNIFASRRRYNAHATLFLCFCNFFFLFSLQNSLHCLLVAKSLYVLHTEITTSHNDRFSLNPRREWCENSEIINKPFDSFNVRCWTERLSETFSPFFNRFHQICFLRFFKRNQKQGERRNELKIVWLQFTPESSVLRKRFCSLLSLHLFVREAFLDFRFLSRTRFNVFATKSSCSLKRRLISDKNFTKLGTVWGFCWFNFKKCLYLLLKSFLMIKWV